MKGEVVHEKRAKLQETDKRTFSQKGLFSLKLQFKFAERSFSLENITNDKWEQAKAYIIIKLYFVLLTTSTGLYSSS